MSVKRDRDIIDELFNGEPFTAVPGLEELDKLIHVCVAPPVKQTPEEKKLLPLPSRKPLKTKKTTHYLNTEIFDGLTQANLTIKKMLPDGEKSRASKSKLVNYALNRLLREIRDDESATSLVQDILDQKK